MKHAILLSLLFSYLSVQHGQAAPAAQSGTTTEAESNSPDTEGAKHSDDRLSSQKSPLETPTKSSPTSFSQEVNPLLRRHCTRCHGENQQEADLRLDDLKQLTQSTGELDTTPEEMPLIVAGDSQNSLLMRRVSDPKHGDLMPLDSEPLTQVEINTLQAWIDNGARIDSESSRGKEMHWSYELITKPKVPKAGDWNSPIDQFIAMKLKEKGLALAEQESSQRLLRRVSLALTGLPPTVDQVEAFAKEPTITAYEAFVDSCLESPNYGERWAVHWLDLARYADSNGFQADQIRDNWAYRDWVIRAFNDSMPHDQFIVQQIAGDLLDNPTVDQRIATGFHRMTTCNVEAGVDPEANRVNQVVDRVNTTATVFLGTTLECAQCHDHKYDPFTQEEYYQLFAYFNNTALEVKNTSDVTWDFYGPKMDLPLTEAQTEQRDDLRIKIQTLESQLAAHTQSSQEAYLRWVGELAESSHARWHSQTPSQFKTTGKEQFEIEPDGAVILTGPVPDKVEYEFTLEVGNRPITAIKLDALTDQRIPGAGPGRGDPKKTNIILSEIELEVVSAGESRRIDLTQPTADFSQKNWEVKKSIDGDLKTGWAISPQFAKPHWASFVLAEPVKPTQETQSIKVTLKQFYGSGRVIGKPRISFYHDPPELLNIEDQLLRFAEKEKRSEKENAKLREAFDQRDATVQKIRQEVSQIRQQLSRLEPDTTLVMKEDSPRETYVMLRGDYENTSEKVTAGIPKILDKNATSIGTNRLDFAKWLVSKDNPLTARVMINHWWAELFGQGLVGTPEDFGTQGDAPSHPALLDWLASELIANRWSMKHIHKQIVMSRTFQQSASISSRTKDLDPNNRWLSRGPRLRMKAEFIRDNALAISGLLSSKRQGPPIMPYQPDNLWRSVGRNQPKWVADQSEDRFRRGIYVVWKRAAPYPSFINFDAPDRGSCTVERSRSNTPMQALTLLNDPAFVEMSLGFADRILSESPSSDDQARMIFAFQLAVSRFPTPLEIKTLKALLEAEKLRLRENNELIERRLKRPSQVVKTRSTNLEDLAAWMSIANALLNLDETICR